MGAFQERVSAGIYWHLQTQLPFLLYFRDLRTFPPYQAKIKTLFFFLKCGARVWTQVLTYTRQMFLVLAPKVLKVINTNGDFVM